MFGQTSGTSGSIPSSPTPFGRKSPLDAASQQQPQRQSNRTVSPHSWHNDKNINHQGLPPDAAFIRHFTPERTGSLPWPSSDFSQKYHSSDPTTERLRTQTDVPFGNGVSEHSKRMRSSPSFASEINHSENKLNSPHKEPQRLDISLPRVASQRKSPINIGNSPSYRRFHPIDYSDIYDAETRSPSKPTYFNALKRDRSPLLPSDNVTTSTHPDRLHPERSDVSPPRLAKRYPSNVATPFRQSSRPLDYSDIYDVGAISPLKSTFNSTKRGRSPPLQSANVPSATSSGQHDPDREMEAKAKRLARFYVEPKPLQPVHDVMMAKSPEANHNQAPLDKKNVDTAAERRRDSDYSDEHLESSQVVVGLCPDMCPESEREERERKGDLDRYERLDGERNQTSKLIAVKKYTRTAEREAVLIRPMPVLQRTIHYLLLLLNRSYDENLLGIYNFLWDRMRAIRMDLRMQHLFNHEAILMLEQMIRLHIIVMHELCEYKKGEGFSEGFDAHLNIEQMNKTSVELFQLYDDHRKKGNNVETEKEFRGYYALLKLDKHPGYKVEPAELSHDLARMTPEIRCTPELLFAREVARACRIGNYVSFFRLAKKATYLQACLMHAHFAKVRRQALASLHSGLPHNQGIPVSHVVKWLGMEEENIESLLEYHGFTLKKFEEIYMVKEGQFLNIDTDLPTKSSQLVHFKKSTTIFDDVYSGLSIPKVSVEEEFELDMINQGRTDTSNVETWTNPKDEEMLHSIDESVHGVGTPTEQLVERPSTATVSRGNVEEITEGSTFEINYASIDNSSSISAHQVDERSVSNSIGDLFTNEENLAQLEGSRIPAGVLGGSSPNHMVENFSPRAVVVADRTLEDEQLLSEPDEDEIFNEKLKMIIRKWKQRSSYLREIREQRELLATAALGSLSLGPPIRQYKPRPRHAIEELNIDFVAKERHGRQEKSWSGLNVSDLVAPILNARENDARCICWKLTVFVQASGQQDPDNQLAVRWLLTKLRGKQSDDGLVASSPHLSIWSNWTDTHISDPETCCLSIVRESILDDKPPNFGDDVLTGTSCIIFVVSETIPWEIQRFRLHSLIMAVPSGSKLPLLIASSDVCTDDAADPSVAITSKLALYDIDSTRIETSSVLFLAGQDRGFFSDAQLRTGLEWLAENSPSQPAVIKVKIHELLLSYLWHATDTLDNMDVSEVGPDQCISAFNEALTRLGEEIIAVASTNPNHWPCPSINLLEESSLEREYATMFLPSMGWSSPARVEPLVTAINACKLACFPTNMTWLQKGSSVGSEIHNQKRALEEWLASYLTQPSCSMHGEQAVSEARLMIQHGAVLELRGSCYYIVPRWSVIFGRIYNWQLMKLATRGVLEAYVLSDEPMVLELSSMSGVVTPAKLDAHVEYQTALSLDEMLEVCCGVPLPPEQPPSVGGHVEIIHQAAHISDIENADETMGDDNNTANNAYGNFSGLVKGRQERLKRSLSEQNNTLSELLERCKKMQDMIDEKLAVYF